MSPASPHSQHACVPSITSVPSIPISLSPPACPPQGWDIISHVVTRVPAGVCSRLAMVHHGMGSFLVFVGLRGSAAELALPATNFWIYPHNDLDGM